MKTLLILLISTLSLNSFANHLYDPSKDNRPELKTLHIEGLDPTLFSFSGGFVKIGNQLSYLDSTYHFNLTDLRALITDAEANVKVIDVFKICKLIDGSHACTNDSPRIITFASRKPTEDESQNIANRKQDLTIKLQKQVEQLTQENHALKKRIKELE